ncbi:hypothetical protein AUF62_03260 [archaeon 13_1_20CM_52_20]|nr:MAG: hypothetical protein AUF62_03260 [archaeon 13_1_20CM_52_20]
MQGTDVYGVLKQIGVTNLYHANSVTTSCTFLEQGGLVSRGFVEDRGLKQTAQFSDESDKNNGIWHRIFLDHVDIHDRAGGKNHYGPVLFQLDLDILLRLAPRTEILVTRKNPVHWDRSDPDSERWFRSKDVLARRIHFGDFDKMLVIKIPSEKLDFPNGRALIILDDPQRKLSSGKNAYNHAKNRLKATVSPIDASIEHRECRRGCRCAREYAEDTIEEINVYFS